MKAPYTAFGKTHVLPVNVYVNAQPVDSAEGWERELWVEDGTDWYAFGSPQLKNKRVRVVTRDEWIRASKGEQ